MGVTIPAVTTLSPSTMVLHTPKLEMTQYKLCFPNKLAQRSLLCSVFQVIALVSCQPRRYYSASEQRLAVFAYLACQCGNPRPWPESKLAQSFVQIIVHRYVLPGCTIKFTVVCRDRILIEAQNDIYFFHPWGSLKVIRLDFDVFGENHSGSNVQMDVGILLATRMVLI